MAHPIAYLVLGGSVAILLYTLAIYPLLLRVAFRRQRPAVRKDLTFQPRVSIVLAVYNGETFLERKLNSLLALDYPAGQSEILVVSDGSTDATDEIAQRYADCGVKLLRLPHEGKAAALNAALPHLSGEIVFFTDVRQPVDREALRHLTANFADPTVGAVTGELRVMDAVSGEQADLDLYWRYELWVRSHHSRINSLFNTTGCLYAIRRELLTPIPADTLTDDAIIPLRAFFAGYRVIFDRLAVAWDYPTAQGAEFRRRLRTLAGMWQAFARMPQLLFSTNPMRLHFLSHKFSRLVMPWAILGCLFSTIALRHTPLGGVLLPGGIAIFVIAGLDALLPQRLPLRRITSPARTFLLLNLAALLSVLVFFVPPQLLWGRATKVVVMERPDAVQ